MPALTVQQIADLCGGEISEGGDLQMLIKGANSLEDAQGSDLAFVDGVKASSVAVQSQAGCLLVRHDFASPRIRTFIRVQEQPRLAFARILKVLYEQPPVEPQIHRTAIVSPLASVSSSCYIGPYSTIGDGVILGERCIIGGGCTVARNVLMGDECRLHDRVTIYEGVKLGKRVILHAGCVIGADGFGFAMAGDHYEKFPQVGTVLIGDDVEVGANSCVDRAALGSTRIGDGTKLDNLVHVAHNCVIGKHVVVAAQTGFSGGVTVGDYVVVGGQVGVADKAYLASKSVIGAQAGIVSRQRIEAGEPVWGTPARPIKQHLKGLAHVGKLSEAFDRLKEVERKVKMLESAFGKD